MNIEGNTIGQGIPRSLVELPVAPIQVNFTDQVVVRENIVAGNSQPIQAADNFNYSRGRTQRVFEHQLDAWMKFDLDGILHDSSGNNVTPTFNRAGLSVGKYDSAALFNSTNSISLTGMPMVESQQRTVSLWFEPKNADLDRKQVLYEEGDANSGFNIYLESGKLFVGAWSNGQFTTFLQTDLKSGGWSHVALVLDGDSNKLRGYLNGRKFAVGTGLNVEARDGEARIGRVSENGTRFSNSTTSEAGNGFAGKIDDVRIYRRVLGDGEVAGLAERI